MGALASCWVFFLGHFVPPSQQISPHKYRFYAVRLIANGRIASVDNSDKSRLDVFASIAQRQSTGQ